MSQFVFYCVESGPRCWSGEWSPYPHNLHALYTGEESAEGLTVVIRTGTKPGDTVFATPCVISPRFYDVLCDLKATGYTTFPAPLVRKGVLLATYFGLIVHGRGGALDPVRSDAEFDETGYLRGYAGVYMYEGDWDGSDVFFIPGLGITLFVSARVAAGIKKAKLRNVELVENSARRRGTKMDHSKYHYATWLKNQAAKNGDTPRPRRKRATKSHDSGDSRGDKDAPPK